MAIPRIKPGSLRVTVEGATSYESLMLVGGTNDGATVTVIKGLPWIEMPKRTATPTTFRLNEPPTAPNDNEHFVRRRVTLAGGRRVEAFILESLADIADLARLIEAT